MIQSATLPVTSDASAIGCVLVLYHPELSALITIGRLATKGYRVCVVINAADIALIHQLERMNGVWLIKNPRNVGLATALNQGIAGAFDDPTVNFVTLFDQDSLPDENLPVELTNELLAMNLANNACIGPRLHDKKAMALAVQPSATNSVPEDVLSIPTSGTVIPRVVYEQVGLMKAAFFIDAIDHEWCFRAKNNGMRVLISSGVSMIHNMGDGAVNWFGRFKPVHRSPLRHYYIVRNHFYLVVHGPAPAIWRCQEFLKLLRRMVVYPFVSNSPLQSAKLVLWAVYDGLVGKLGECRHFP